MVSFYSKRNCISQGRLWEIIFVMSKALRESSSGDPYTSQCYIISKQEPLNSLAKKSFYGVISLEVCIHFWIIVNKYSKDVA